MSKKAIYTVDGVYFSVLENAKAEAEKNGNNEKPKKSFVTEDEFLTMLDDGLIIDFELTEGEAPEAAPKPQEQTPDIAEVLKRLEVLEEENRKLKAEHPRKQISFEEIQAAIAEREALQVEVDKLLEVKEDFEQLRIDETDRFSLPKLNIEGRTTGNDAVSLMITNPFAIRAVVEELLKLVSEKITKLLEEVDAVEKRIA